MKLRYLGGTNIIFTVYQEYAKLSFAEFQRLDLWRLITTRISFLFLIFWLRKIKFPSVPSCSEEFGSQSMWRSSKASNVEGDLELGYDEQKIQELAASKVGSQELRSLIFKVFYLSWFIFGKMFVNLWQIVFSWYLGWKYPYSGKDLSIGKPWIFYESFLL